jgi:hypothetical protein
MSTQGGKDWDDRGEADVQDDEEVAGNRDTGGVPDPAAPDQSSTTGTTPKGGYVGRVAGDDPGETEESGAEARARGSAGT